MRIDGQLPWRGPGADCPDVPLPPESMPLLSRGQLRKRWRYVGVFCPQLMLCAARAQVGPFSQTFWVMWDREAERRWAHTSFRPGGREVTMNGPDIEIAAHGLTAQLHLGDGAAVEAICPSGSAWGWTRKRAGVPAHGAVQAGGRRWEVEGLGIDDESAGYHRRHTSWLWSAGVGSAADGRALAWNLVEGVNDPAERSERAIWVEGQPFEPRPVSFRGMAGVDFSEGSRLEFARECERARNENLLVIRSRYRLRFGTFSGHLEGLPLAEGLGVMEEHDAHW